MKPSEPAAAAEATQDADVRREIRELRLLFEISQQLDRHVDLRDVLEPVLGAMATHMGLLRGALWLLDQAAGEVFIDVAHGLSDSQRLRGRYKIGEGITGRVVETGEPAIVPRIGDDPDFLDRAGGRRGHSDGDHSFVCVPIKLEGAVIGTLSADRRYDPRISLDGDVKLLRIVASMIAEAVRLRTALHEERRALIEENARLQRALQSRFQPANIIGTSKAMRSVYELMSQVCRSDTTVLLRGESGAGKELIANAIHYNSPRAGKPFIKVNLAALPDSVIESELFGHEKGAFTGALAQRKGRFELAHGGTIFLDEIGDLSPATQVALLRVLQEREFERVGGSVTIRTDVRVIAATNRDLEQLMRDGGFREDLYYRLNVFPIHAPALRERPTDIPLLVDFFVEKYAKGTGRSVKRVSTPAIDMLMKYHWPGNVRELENCVERAVLLCTDEVIRAHHLPPTLQTADGSGTTYTGTLESALETFERELIVDALKNARGNMAEAARSLGVTERVIGLRVKRFGLNWRDHRPPRG